MPIVDETNIIAHVYADLARGTVQPVQVECTQYDAEMRVIAVHLRENNREWNIPSGYAVNVRMKKQDSTSVYNPQQGEGNTAYITLSAQMCGVAGTQYFVVEIVKGDDVVQTVPIRLNVRKNPIDDATFTSSDEYKTIQGLVEEAQDAAEESQTNANQAYTWAQNTLTLYHQTENLKNDTQTLRDQAQTAATTAQTLAAQVEDYAEQVLGISVPAVALSQSEYDALDPPDPKTLYIVESDGPQNSLVVNYPLTQNLSDGMDGSKVATATGCQGLGNWDGTGPSFNTAPASGSVGQHQNYLTLPSNLLSGMNFANGITLALDLKPNATAAAGNGDWTRLINLYKHSNSPTGTAEGELYLTQGVIATAYYDGVTAQYLDASKAGLITAGAWHTVALTLGGGYLSVYLDGALVGQQPDTTSLLSQLANVDQCYIGNSRFADNDYAGLVKNFRIYDKALSAAEIGQLSQASTWKLYYGAAQDETLNQLQKAIQDITSGTTNLPYLKTSGGTMEGPVDMDSHAITGLPDPTADTDAVPKGWADGRYALAFATPRYGVRFSGSGNTGSTVTRLYDAVGLTAAVGTDTDTAVNDFDSIAPWSTRRRCCGYWDDSGQFVINAYEGEPGYTTDGSNGEVWVEQSLWYYQHTVSEDGVEEITISTYQYPGFSPAPIFLSQGGQAQPYLKAYTAAYPMATVDGKPTSRSGVFPGTYSLNSAMTAARTAGESYCTTTVGEWYSDWLLMVVEFATRNLQSIMVGATQLPWYTTHTALEAETGVNRIIISAANASGYVVGQTIGIGTTQGGDQVCSNRRITSIETVEGGAAINFNGAPVDIAVGNMIYSLAWITGICDGVQSSSGSPTSNTSGKYQCIYRGKEKPYGDCFEWCCDVLFQRRGAGSSEDPYTYTAHYLPDPTKYSNGSITEDYVQLGYGVPETDGYAIELGLDERFPWVRIPSALGGSTSTYYSDYYQYPRSAVTAGRLGGYWAGGGGAGPACWNCNDAPSGSWVVSRARLSFHRT